MGPPPPPSSSLHSPPHFLSPLILSPHPPWAAMDSLGRHRQGPCPCLPKGTLKKKKKKKKKNVNFYDVPKGLKRSKRVKKGPKTTKKSKNQNCELRGRPPPM